MRGSPRVASLDLTDFRCFEHLAVRFGGGLTVLVGANGQGKTSLLEAIGWMARGRSVRGVPDSALVRIHAPTAVLRADISEGERTQTFAAEIGAAGRSRIRVNDHPLPRRRDLVGLLRVTVFTPDDLRLVKGGPAERRDYLDDLLCSIAPRYEQARSDYERVLRQRNALLKSGGRDRATLATLDVFDESLVAAGAEIVRGRLGLGRRLAATATDAYDALADSGETVEARYQSDWSDTDLVGADGSAIATALREALTQNRNRELERRLTLVGPHRDEWRLSIGALDARTHSSQGEQRSLSLALRLAGHMCVRETTGTTPVLLLDDVFSELDARRARSLVSQLPHGQTVLTTASGVPDAVEPERVLSIVDRRIEECRS